MGDAGGRDAFQAGLERYGSLFVPADVRRVQIPLRLPTSGRIRPMEVEIRTAGAKRGRTVVGDDWVRRGRAGRGRPTDSATRIDLNGRHSLGAGANIVAATATCGGSVQVGELRLLRE
jgi:hypothetical protein